MFNYNPRRHAAAMWINAYWEAITERRPLRLIGRIEVLAGPINRE